MFQLSEFLPARPEPWWPLLLQSGVRNAVAMMRGAEQEQRIFASVVGATEAPRYERGAEPWSERALGHDVATFAEQGFDVVAVEDTPPMDEIRMGGPGRDQQIEQVIQQVRAMGALQIPVLCYNWMVGSSWSRTRSDLVTRGGALVTGFALDEANARGPIRAGEQIDAGQLWDALAYFLAAVVPEAESAGVRLALHPDDPPLAVVREMPRIMSSLEGYRRLRALNASASNAITFCQGNFALMTEDVPSAIKEFGADDAIAFVHFRDLRGRAADFVETFHDDGQTDMAACMRAYEEVGFRGPLRPDHVPTMAGEVNDRPGYQVLGRLFAAGYIRGLEHAVFGHPAARV